MPNQKTIYLLKNKKENKDRNQDSSSGKEKHYILTLIC
jgi:hypothetical protein